MAPMDRDHMSAARRFDADTVSLQGMTERLAQITHDLRDPLSIIKKCSELLKEERNLSNEERLAFIDIIQRNSQQLLVQVDDLSDYAALTSGQVKIRPQYFDFMLELERLELSYRKLGEQKNVHFELDIHRPIPHFLFTDPVRMNQILNNILGNAFKYTSAGTVRLEVDCTGIGNRSQIGFVIEDTGAGVPPEVRERLFLPFVSGPQLNASRGTGLGLYISKSLAERLGGTIELLHSDQNEGTAIRVCISTTLSSISSF